MEQKLKISENTSGISMKKNAPIKGTDAISIPQKFSPNIVLRDLNLLGIF